MRSFCFSVAVFAALAGPALAQNGRTGLAMVAARADTDTPEANATVWIGGCSGALVVPDMIVAAAPCLETRARPVGGGGLACDDPQSPCGWQMLPAPVSVRVGNDTTLPLFETSAAEYTLPGCADVALLRLKDAVPAEHARPVKVLTRLGGRPGALPAAALDGERLYAAGWIEVAATEMHPLRQAATLRLARLDENAMYLRPVARLRTAPRDPGGPVYWRHASGRFYLVGLGQGSGADASEAGYTPTFGNPHGEGAGVGAFLEATAPDAVSCDAMADRPAGTVPLVTWWSQEFGDNLTTTSTDWIGCHGARRAPDYSFSQVEGYIFAPDAPQPRGTIRLQSWIDRGRGDHAIRTHPTWISWKAEDDGGGHPPDYTLSRLEGYVFDPALPQPPGTVPLHQWYSPGRQDNWTTTRYPDKGGSGLDLTPDYAITGLVGYVYPASGR